jgi:hypothetical protein
MFFGVYRGNVLDASTIGSNGHVTVNVPAVGAMTNAVAPVCYSCSCAWAIQTGATVAVAFEGGDPSRPIVLGQID